MFSSFRSNKLYVPLATILGCGALFFVYHFIYVASQRNYADERAFRLLAVAGDQMGRKFENLNKVLSASLVPSSAADYLKQVRGYKDEVTGVIARPCPTGWNRQGD